MTVYVIEGVDGTGKSTLADRIAAETSGVVLHISFKPEWNIHLYHLRTMEYAQALSAIGIDCILDRWALSEYVYGTVFRAGPSYDIEHAMHAYHVKWIYCRNDDAVENHIKNREERYEMFDDVADAFSLYEAYIQASDLDWSVFDFNEVITDDFVEELLGG